MEEGHYAKDKTAIYIFLSEFKKYYFYLNIPVDLLSVWRLLLIWKKKKHGIKNSLQLERT